MLNNLTEDQINKFPEYIKKYTEIGLDTIPIDFEKAKKAIAKVYICGELAPPEKIVYCTSPLSAIITINILRSKKETQDSMKNSVWNFVVNSVWNSVYNSVWNSVRNSVENSMWDSVENSVWDSVENSVYSYVYSSVWNSVWDSVVNSVENSVYSSVYSSVVNSVRNSVRDSVWNSVENSVKDSVGDLKLEFISSTLEGQYNVGFVSFYQFFRNECGLKEQTEKMTGIFELTENAGWVY